MTQHTHTVTEARCDGLLATACDQAHPDRPHTCPAALSIADANLTALTDALRAARWATTRGPDGHQRHYCPAHRDQGLPTAVEDATAIYDSDGHAHPASLPCLAGCPAYGTRQGPLEWVTDQHTDLACDHDWNPVSKGQEVCTLCGGVRRPAGADCEAKGWSGEGRCIEPADGPDGLCAAHRAHRPGIVATPPHPQWDEKGKQHQSPG